MLNIYIGRENLPSDKKFIRNPQPLASDLNLLLNSFAKEVLLQIEQGVPQSRDTYIDRFGRGLYSTTLSMSTVILLAVNQLTDFIINGDELGSNAFNILCRADTGSIYFSDGIRDIENVSTPFALNGKICHTEQDIWEMY